jgi:hypothetical protein
MQNSKFFICATLMVVIIIGILFLWIIWGKSSDSDIQPPPKLSAADCGEILDACQVSTTLKLDSCKKDFAEKRLHEALGKPLEIPTCRDLHFTLSSRCPASCQLDYDTVIAVPGRIVIEGSDIPDESGRCAYTGTRQVSVRASCRPIP